jgi:tRNA (guanine-N7-)-methyltransferase
MRTSSPKQLSHGARDRWDTGGVLLDESVAAVSGTPLDFGAMFGNTRPVELEIGCGKGTFILARAQARPEVNLLGVEWARAYCLYAADRCRRAGVANVRMLRIDAALLVSKLIAPQSLWRIHIYFPDPWPKARHHRRRLIQPAFVARLHELLKPGGQLLIVTDHLDYFKHIRRVVAAATGFVSVPFPQMGDTQGELVGTNFERKYIAQGRPFYKAALMRY